MIEITYHTSEESGENVIVKPPKNIRQIGSPRGRHKIYIEDYVHTYLHSSMLFGENQQRAAILLGRSEVSQDIRYTFIEGAINCEDYIFQKEGIVFDESCWQYIYQEMKQYFDQQIIVGWFLGRPGFPLKVSHTVEAAQRKYFSGRDKVLYLWDPEESEDAFFAYEQGTFQKKEGYYVYYEKNLAMQEYMVCQKEMSREAQGGIQEMTEGFSELQEWEEPAAGDGKRKEAQEVQNKNEAKGDMGTDRDSKRDLETGNEAKWDMETGKDPKWDMKAGNDDKWDMQSGYDKKEAIRTRSGGTEGKGAPVQGKRMADAAIGNYRNMLREREKKHSGSGKNLFLYGAATVALIAVCISGVVNLNSYQKMKQMEEVLLMISQPLEEQKAQEQKDKQQISVQNVPGQVSPKEDTSAETTPGSDEEAASQSQVAEPSGQPTSPQEGASQQTPAQETEGQPADGQAEQPENAGNPQQSQDTQAQQNAGEAQSQPQEGADSQEAMVQAYLEQGYYVVQPGDRLESICRRLYPDSNMMEKLCEINQIEDVNKILVGQKLILP